MPRMFRVPSLPTSQSATTLSEQVSELLPRARALLDDNQCHCMVLWVFNKPLVVAALLDGLILLEDFVPLSVRAIEALGSIAFPSLDCVRALVDGQITLARLAAMDISELAVVIQSGDYSSFSLNSPSGEAASQPR